MRCSGRGSRPCGCPVPTSVLHECLLLCLRALQHRGSAAPCPSNSGREGDAPEAAAVGDGSTVGSGPNLPGPRPPSRQGSHSDTLCTASAQVLRQLSPDNPICSLVLYFLAFLIVPSPTCVPGITRQRTSPCVSGCIQVLRRNGTNGVDGLICLCWWPTRFWRPAGPQSVEPTWQVKSEGGQAAVGQAGSL